MKILDVIATPFQLPMRRVLKFASGQLTHKDHVLIEVITEDGVTGIGEAIPRTMVYGETTGSVLAAIEHIKPLICGQEIGYGGWLQRALRHLENNNTVRGALDIAVADATARQLGISCWRLLGGDGAGASVRVTALLSLGSAEELIDEARSFTERFGVECFKVKVGLDVPADIRRCTACREAFPDQLIYVDANHQYSGAQAREFIRGTAGLNLSWIEEPTDTRAGLGRRAAVSASQVPILADEGAQDVASACREMLDGHASMISVKVARTGLTGSRDVLSAVTALGGDVVIGSQGDSAINTYAALQFAGLNAAARRYPAEITSFLDSDESITTSSPVITNGTIAIPDEPGLGLLIDRDRLSRFSRI
jgi:L-alanine-DL-glutamate epimerase-like enolase superfamily enzyme